jgi:ubiquinone/menaquinone biosynthesis C-methylase UbiE
MSQPHRPNYGIDAPHVLLTFLAVGLTVVLLSLWVRFLWITGAIFLLECLVMVWASRVGKFRVRDKLLNSVSWRGNEQVLDIGCGHGLMLIGAAKRLRDGKATGIDLWQKQDQAGNSREATLLNVRLENVADRVELVDGDARKLPFMDNAFDVVVSSWALHNIYNRTEREGAVREAARVLKPGGRILLIDIRHTGQYAKVLRQSNLSEVRRSGPNFLFLTPSFTVTARKKDSA